MGNRNPRYLFVFIVLASTSLSGLVSGEKKDKCDTCNGIVEAFKKGIQKTIKANFGGGNTAWEERALGSYATSETRLIEIIESLCDSSECHSMVEEHEESLEKWWFKLQDKEKDLKNWFCINELKVCCPNGTYGSDCKECPSGKDSPCSDHGDCQGAGTRSGSGKCECHAGYEGDACDECKDDFFEDKDENNKMKCTACHESCAQGCNGSTPKDCTACKAGWEQSEEEGCKDVDECKMDDKCSGGKYCINTPGSYECQDCHESCEGNCTGDGAKGCQACKSGYTMSEEDGCKDNDECAEDTSNSLCAAGQFCKNTPGTYECTVCDAACELCIGEGAGSCSKCTTGYERKEGACKDIDECSADPNPCDTETESCTNNPGSYSCDCRNAYEKKGDKCVKRRKDTKKVEKEEEDDDEDDDDDSGDDKSVDDDDQGSADEDKGKPDEDKAATDDGEHDEL